MVSLGDFWLVILLVGLIGGWLGGMGGQRVATAALRKELRATLELVDSDSLRKVSAALSRLDELHGAQERATSAINSFRAQLSTIDKRKGITPDDVAFLVRAELGKALQRPPVAPAVKVG